jgi:hypothetical protein
MTGRGQPRKTSIAASMGAARTVSHRCPPPLEIAARFPHSHRADGFLPIPDSERNRTSLWAVEKWKSKTTIPTFPPPRSACGARKEIDSSLSEPPPSHEERSTFPCTRYFTRPGSSFDEKMLASAAGPTRSGRPAMESTGSGELRGQAVRVSTPRIPANKKPCAMRLATSIRTQPRCARAASSVHSVRVSLPGCMMPPFRRKGNHAF